MILRFFSICLFLALSCSAYAQLKIYSIQKAQVKDKTTEQLNARTENNTLTLPFWEDFSKSSSTPTDTLWEQSQNVFISPGLGLNPPSISVASFDGLVADGTGYSGNATSEGPTDALNSCPFDFTTYTAADDIYLSFFYQYAGNGDNPELSDSLRVEFMDADSSWIPVWPRNGASLDRSGSFEQVILAVDQDEFFNDEFRFRFQSFGRQSGPFDTWNVDYIYMNEGRSLSDLFYPDRSIITPLSSLFGEYASIPNGHFNGNTVRAEFRITNLDDGFAQPYDFDINLSVTNYLDSAILSTNNFSESDVEPTPPSSLSPINVGAIDTVFIPDLLSPADFNTNSDSTLINYEILLDSDDEIDSEPLVSIIDFTLNDTIRGEYVLRDFYAYDDGSAEVGAGLNFSGSRLAYQFEKFGDTLNYIHAFDIYFPYLNESPNGKSINLSVWEDDDGEPGLLAFDERISISKTPGLNVFTRFELSAPVLIEDSIFYIGYRQNTAGDLAVGLDKNNDTSSRIFFNLSGSWEQDDNIPGSLMLRPVFGPEPEIITSIDDVLSDEIAIFPNPVNDMLTINKKVDHIELYRINGIREQIEIMPYNDGLQIKVSHLLNGIYLIKFINNGNLVVRKIIKR